MIAVADGLGGHTRGDEAAQAAVEGLPRRIASPEDERRRRTRLSGSLALTGPEMWSRRLPLFMYPMSTLCVAAWTPEGRPSDRLDGRHRGPRQRVIREPYAAGC